MSPLFFLKVLVAVTFYANKKNTTTLFMTNVVVYVVYVISDRVKHLSLSLSVSVCVSVFSHTNKQTNKNNRRSSRDA